ncbi:hypothetical protein X743_34485 [Mesorhizobium sp. LNHC252B00]|nr:hypothetical protein X743_34485 [Mesorhizobium sp. LNHC252B00]
MKRPHSNFSGLQESPEFATGLSQSSRERKTFYSLDQLLLVSFGFFTPPIKTFRMNSILFALGAVNS